MNKLCVFQISCTQDFFSFETDCKFIEDRSDIYLLEKRPNGRMNDYENWDMKDTHEDLI